MRLSDGVRLGRFTNAGAGGRNGKHRDGTNGYRYRFGRYHECSRTGSHRSDGGNRAVHGRRFYRCSGRSFYTGTGEHDGRDDRRHHDGADHHSSTGKLHGCTGANARTDSGPVGGGSIQRQYAGQLSVVA